MNVVPAQVAGVKEIVLISPPQKGSNPPAANNLILAAAGLLQKTAAKTKIEIYKVGGAQGIAALAFGTETVPKVDKIVGPGNLYVTLAKKLLYGLVGIDKLAGPSEVLVVADDSADAELVAAEILAQAEHDPDARAMLVSTSQKLIEAVSATVTVRCAGCRRKTIAERALKNNGWAVLAKSQTEMLSIANEIGAEHVVVMTKNATALSAQITNAGAIFIGAYSPVALGDYWAGPNHVLPTGGTARFSSPLGVWDFVKRQSVIHYSKAALKKAAADIEILAEGEGLEAHARSVKRVDQ
jgi:histidinol dehydrogenase